MRIAMAQMKAGVGEFDWDVEKALGVAGKAEGEGGDVVVFPEFALSGYPARDWLLREEFVDESLAALERFAKGVKGIVAVVGYAAWNASGRGKDLWNAVGVVEDGVVRHSYVK